MTQDEETAAFIERIQRIRENGNKLNGCKQHNFPLPDCNATLDKFQCSNCGGTVDLARARWYMMGLKHGQGMKEVEG